MKEILAVFIGGGLGSLARFGLARGLNVLSPYGFPLGTFCVNVAACFILGMVVGLAEQKAALSTLSRVFWAVGFCGGFSTFSTFSYENVLLFQTGQNQTLFFYSLLSLLVCFAAVFGGQYIAARI